MAVSGSGGWIPSCGVYLWRGEVRLTPITQNKPRSVVETDIDRAARRIIAGEIVQVDMRGGLYGAVRARVEQLLSGG
jgi:hypothetical protein